jgi:glycosyltransferase involved in cell wall biosynthesis
VRIGIDASIAKLNQAGSGTYASSLIDALQRIDTANCYCLFADTIQRQMGQRKTLRSRLDTVWHDLAWTHMRLPYYARRKHVDLLHVPSSVMPVFAPCPTVISILDVTVLESPQNFNAWQRSYSRLFIPLSARRTSLIVTISEHSKRDIVEHLHVPSAKIAVTQLAASPDFRPISADDIAAIKLRYNLRSFILTVGTLEPRKNISRLLEAFASLDDACQLVHVGPNGWLFDEALNRVDRLKLQDKVRFLGYIPQDDLIALYNAASVFVYPSLYEGFGIPILEAMACGCPVITSSRSAMPEVAGDAALLIDPFSVQEMADAIRRLLDEPELAASLRAKGFARARLFSWERCAQETLEVYRRALGGGTFRSRK